MTSPPFVGGVRHSTSEILFSSRSTGERVGIAYCSSQKRLVEPAQPLGRQGEDVALAKYAEAMGRSTALILSRSKRMSQVVVDTGNMEEKDRLPMP
jgi:hypothetical protein